MVCKNCDPLAWYWYKELAFTQVQADEQVQAGDIWHIYIDIKNHSMVFGDKGRVCVYEGDQVIAQSEQFKIGDGEVYRTVLSGPMPNRDLYLNVSLIDEDLWTSTCADGQEVYIPVGTTVPVDPVDPIDQDDDEEDDGWSGWFEDVTDSAGDLSLLDWIQKNLITVLILILVIIIAIKFG